MSAAMRANWVTRSRVFTPEHRAKIAAALAGKPGTPWTDEQRAKLSVSRMGRVFSAETRAKISAAQIGKTISAEARAKLSRFKLPVMRYTDTEIGYLTA